MNGQVLTFTANGTAPSPMWRPAPPGRCWASPRTASWPAPGWRSQLTATSSGSPGELSSPAPRSTRAQDKRLAEPAVGELGQRAGLEFRSAITAFSTWEDGRDLRGDRPDPALGAGRVGEPGRTRTRECRRRVGRCGKYVGPAHFQSVRSWDLVGPGRFPDRAAYPSGHGPGPVLHVDPGSPGSAG